MKLKLLIILLCLLPLPAMAGGLMMVGGGVSAVAGGSENIGYETEGALASSFGASQDRCTKMPSTPAHSGSVTSITFTGAYGTAEGYIKLSLYTHDAVNDLPASLVTNSGSTEITVSSDTYGDITFTYGATKPVVTSGTQYWICGSASSTGQVNFHYADPQGRSCTKTDTYGTWAPWGGSGDWCGTNSASKCYFNYSY
jgi:hypothetical protein